MASVRFPMLTVLTIVVSVVVVVVGWVIREMLAAAEETKWDSRDE